MPIQLPATFTMDMLRSEMGDRPGYAWLRVDEGIVVFDVEIVTVMYPGERELEVLNYYPIDEQWLMDAVALDALRRAQFKHARLLIHHNPAEAGEAPAENIGKVLDTWYERPWIRGNLLISSPTGIEQAMAGRLPGRSAEFYPRQKLLYALALLPGETPHYDAELPQDFNLTADTEVLLMESPETVLVSASMKDMKPLKASITKDTDMEMKEQVESLTKMVTELKTTVDGLVAIKAAAEVEPDEAAVKAAEEAAVKAEAERLETLTKTVTESVMAKMGDLVSPLIQKAVSSSISADPQRQVGDKEKLAASARYDELVKNKSPIAKKFDRDGYVKFVLNTSGR